MLTNKNKPRVQVNAVANRREPTRLSDGLQIKKGIRHYRENSVLVLDKEQEC